MIVSSSIGLLALSILAPPGEPAVSVEQLKESVQRSVPYLTERTMTEMHRTRCISCHTRATQQWALNMAQRQGLTVDRAKLNEANDWTARYLREKVVMYQLGDKSFALFERIGVPKTDQELLKKSVKDPFGQVDDFLEKLKTVLSPEILSKHQSEIVRTATRPNDFKVEDTRNMGYALILSGFSGTAEDSAELTKRIVDVFVKSQDKDGSWEPAGQIYFANGQDRPFVESREIATAWNLLALASISSPSPEAARARDRAQGYLMNASPGVTTEALVVRLLVAQSLGEIDEAQVLCQELLRQQLPEGGWGWRKNSHSGNPYNTGMALHALARMKLYLKNPSVQRGVRFLLQTQDAKTGAWLMKGEEVRRGRGNDWLWQDWGTSWAVVGLLSAFDS